MNRDVRRFEINGKFYNLEQVSKLIKTGKWDAAVNTLQVRIGLGADEAREVARQLKSINDGVEYRPSENKNNPVTSPEDNNLGRAIKWSGMVIGIIGVILSMYMGVEMSNSYLFESGTGFAFLMATASVTLGLVVSGIGEIIILLNRIRYNTEK